MHYSKKYNIRELIHNFCSDEWKSLLQEKELHQKYAADVQIFNQGDISERIKILTKGKVKVHLKNKDGDEQILRLASDGQILGHRAFGGDFKYSVSATTLTESEVVDIPIKLFLSLLKANNEFCFNFMMFFAEELKNSEYRTSLNKTNNVEQRVAVAILDNLFAFGYDIKDKKLLAYTISRKDFSQLSNTRYESVIRTFKRFKDNNLIDFKRKRMEILNEDGLIQIANLT